MIISPNYAIKSHSISLKASLSTALKISSLTLHIPVLIYHCKVPSCFILSQADSYVALTKLFFSLSPGGAPFIVFLTLFSGWLRPSLTSFSSPYALERVMSDLKAVCFITLASIKSASESTSYSLCSVYGQVWIFLQFVPFLVCLNYLTITLPLFLS